jgi:hypothetical protein
MFHGLCVLCSLHSDFGGREDVIKSCMLLKSFA